MTKKAFTIIEIIFVIIILGILSTIIIPRLQTTRDDAKVAFCTEAITLFIRDLSTFYTSQGAFSLNMRDMTNVNIYETVPISKYGNTGEYYYVCDNIKKDMNASDAAITFKFFNAVNIQGNVEINLNATMASINQGTVDGDLGNLLNKKHIATDRLGINHTFTGIRVKK